MSEFGKMKKVPLRNIWPHEANNFTPWLAENIFELGEVLGMDLELVEREAAVGGFSLDLLAKDLSTSQPVVIENQFNQTNHDHLGKLLTYAAGFDAYAVIWVSEEFREEHRQALDWLNQRTDTETQFFAVVLEVLKIDEFRPAFNFKLVVAPNEWQKINKSPPGHTSSRGLKYCQYFQLLMDELRENYHFTSAKKAQPQNWCGFSAGLSGIGLNASFAGGGKARTEIYIDRGDQEENKMIFDELKNRCSSIVERYGNPIEWERLDDKRACRIAIYRDGSILDSESELEQIQEWHIQNLLKLKEVVVPEIEAVMKSLE